MGLFFFLFSFPPSLHFLEGSKQSILSLFLFPVIALFCWSMIICFACCWCSLWDCFVWLIRAAAKDPNLPPPPTTEENDRMWRSDGEGGKHSSLPAAVFMLTLTRALISSRPPPQRTYHREASVTSLVRMERRGGRLAGFQKPHFYCLTKPVAQYDRF